MIKEYFTIDDLATMTMLSTRTLRNYMNQGFLHGEKMSGVWKFSIENIETFMKNDFVNQSIQSKKNGIVFDYMANDVKKENMVCAIYDYPHIENNDAENICNKMMGLVNSNHYSYVRFSYSYNGKKKMVRIILTGSILGIHNLMNDFNALNE